MKRGLLIYRREDYEKNQSFADALCNEGPSHGLDIDLVIAEDVVLGVDGRTLFWDVCKQPGNIERKSTVDFVINRTRLCEIGEHFEALGARVFNRAEFTRIANDKFKTHRFLARHGIPSLKTMRCFGKTERLLESDDVHVVKTVDGHGGREVFLSDELLQAPNFDELANKDLIFQKLAEDTGRDLRVFLMGEEVIGAVERVSDSDFRANYSLGGEARKYILSESEEELVKDIANLIDGDFYGLDFLLTEDGLIFNEVEDVVGSRTLCLTTGIDIVDSYLNYIAEKIYY